MKISIFIIMLGLLFLNLQVATAEENKYGIVKAWFNDKNATIETIEGIKLKVGEPVEIKIEATSKIDGHAFILLTEPGVTKAYNVLNGPSKLDESIDNLKIGAGWSKSYSWIITPNGAWKNGNAPINILVKFYNLKTKDDKIIQFTIANPYILDEQYTGAAATATPAPEITGTGAPAKETPFLPAIFTVSTLLLAWRLKKIVR